MKTEKAEFPGTCRICGGRIYVGDIIMRSEVSGVPTACHAACDLEVNTTASSVSESK